MFSKTLLVAASLLSAVSASPCVPRPGAGGSQPLLPSTGATDLPAPPANLTLKSIAIGHGIQNYTCTNNSAAATAAGALAVLYDVTPLYPGTPQTGLSAAGFDALSTTILWTSDVPLLLTDPAAANPGTPSAPNANLPPSAYGATTPPFPSPASDLTVGNMAPLKFLGHHYFDADGAPTFDLQAKSLLFSVALKGSVDQPAAADKGVLATGAVKWLQLADNGKGKGNTPNGMVYRVITAGGAAQACTKDGAVPKQSVPYTAFYWFFA